MISFGGVVYYIDLDKISEVISLDTKLDKKIIETIVKEYADGEQKITGSETLTTTKDRELSIDSTKYEMIRIMIDILTDGMEEIDDALGAEHALEKTSLGFKIAFNTLHNYGILKEVED